MCEIEETIANAIKQQCQASPIGWFERRPDEQIGIVCQRFDIRALITALEVAGYRIIPATRVREGKNA